MTLPFTTLPGEDPKPFRWWQFRRRSRRLAFLELVAATEIRISLDGVPRMAGTLEGAYGTVVGFGSADHARGLAFADVLTLRHHEYDDDEDHVATISLRVPLAIRL